MTRRYVHATLWATVLGFALSGARCPEERLPDDYPRLGAPPEVHARPASRTEIHVVVEPVDGATRYEFLNVITHDYAILDSTRWVNDGLTPGGEYAYMVSAVNDSARSATQRTAPVRVRTYYFSHEGPADTHGGLYAPRFTVTSSADSGPGTLRDALESPGPVYIDFAGDVTTITLEKRIRVTKGHWTIEGGSGVTVITPDDDPGLVIDADRVDPEAHCAHDFVVRNVRFTAGLDNVTIGGEMGVGARDGVFDQCAFTFGSDGNADTGQGAHRITWVGCYLGEESAADKSQLLGSGWSDHVEDILIRHSLRAYEGSRGPQIQGDYQRVAIVNVFHLAWESYQIRAQCHGPDHEPCPEGLAHELDVVGNYFVVARDSTDDPETGWSPHTGLILDDGTDIEAFTSDNWSHTGRMIENGKRTERWTSGPEAHGGDDVEAFASWLPRVGPATKTPVEQARIDEALAWCVADRSLWLDDVTPPEPMRGGGLSSSGKVYFHPGSDNVTHAHDIVHRFAFGTTPDVVPGRHDRVAPEGLTFTLWGPFDNFPARILPEAPEVFIWAQNQDLARNDGPWYGPRVWVDGGLVPID